jgi:hypothetical protein
MKKNILLLVFFLINGINNIVQAQKVEWDFPVKPGSQKWKAFKSSQEMFNSCEIPNDILKKLKTKELLDISLRYPLLLDYSASNSAFDGIKNISHSFNGFKEFLTRKDAPKILFQNYSDNKIENIINVDDKGDFVFKICAIELLLGQDEIISSL